MEFKLHVSNSLSKGLRCLFWFGKYGGKSDEEFSIMGFYRRRQLAGSGMRTPRLTGTLEAVLHGHSKAQTCGDRSKDIGRITQI